MTVRQLAAVRVTESWAGHGEGPVWDPTHHVLRWVDMLRGDVLSWRPGYPSASRLHVGELAAVVRPRRSGGLVLAIERGFALAADLAKTVEPLTPIWTDPTLRMNDGACDPQGRFYCGSMDRNAAPGLGVMYRLDADGAVQVVLRGLTISNGLAFSDDGKLAYLIDTPTQCVMRYVVDDLTGDFVSPVPIIEIAAEHGAPDGMTIDAEGGFWIAMWDGYAVRHYGPDGDLRAIVALPVSRPTACTFGGLDRRDLYITSSSEGISKDAEPAAGAVFALRPGVSGRSTEFFDG